MPALFIIGMFGKFTSNTYYLEVHTKNQDVRENELYSITKSEKQISEEYFLYGITFVYISC